MLLWTEASSISPPTDLSSSQLPWLAVDCVETVPWLMV
jgi:hypothetical protein